VDTGVGGSVALAVGEKLAKTAAARQVLAVTHLPQVACRAGTHFHVEKSTSGGRTSAKVRRLEGEPRLEAIALMLGGRTATEASRRHAKELMESI
jgi:DNA repair protein RecN (Recombination protein N)